MTIDPTSAANLAREVLPRLLGDLAPPSVRNFLRELALVHGRAMGEAMRASETAGPDWPEAHKRGVCGLECPLCAADIGSRGWGDPKRNAEWRALVLAVLE